MYNECVTLRRPWMLRPEWFLTRGYCCYESHVPPLRFNLRTCMSLAASLLTSRRKKLHSQLQSSVEYLILSFRLGNKTTSKHKTQQSNCDTTKKTKTVTVGIVFWSPRRPLTGSSLYLFTLLTSLFHCFGAGANWC